MKNQVSQLSARYLTGLRGHLAPGAKLRRPRAAGLGRRAVALGLETLDLARIHEQALTTLVAPGSSARTRERMINRAAGFFAEAVSVIEQTHRGARAVDAQVNRIEQALRERTVESNASARRLRQGVRRRQAAETALERSTTHRAQLLAEARRLQQELRRLTHEILAGQEAGRLRLSHQLHDDIAQILLAINVRLVTLREAATTNTASLKKEIANTQQLVRESAETISGFTRKFDRHHES